MKVAPPAMSEPKQEEEVAPLVIDLVLLRLVYQRVIQQQAVLGDLPVAMVKTEPVPPTRTTIEQGGDQLEPEMESSSISPALSSPSASNFVEATKAGS